MSTTAQQEKTPSAVDMAKMGSVSIILFITTHIAF